MDISSSFSGYLRRASRGWVLLLIALVQFLLHLWVNAHDNFFRDELYYLAAAQHLGLGYVEYPPLVAFAVAFARAVFGDSVVAIRMLPAIAGALIVLLTADMVAVLGGGLAAQALAAIAVAVGPVFIGSSGLMTMDPFDQLWWTLAAWVLVRLIKNDLLGKSQPRLWLVFGVVAGLGLLTKLTIVFFIIALLVGLLLSSQRKLLFNRWLILGGAIALVIFSPFIAWEIQHGFPVLEYTKAYASGKTFQATPLEYFGEQVQTINPFAIFLWFGGLYFLFFTPIPKTSEVSVRHPRKAVEEAKTSEVSSRPYRAFGWAYLFLYVFFMIQHAKFYWLSPAYPMVFASGAYGLELLVRQRPRLRWMQPAYLAILAITGLLLVPFAIPILPLQTFIHVNASMGGKTDVKTENLQTSFLPQNYADRYGWREMVTTVKQAYDTLTPQEQAEACILTSNYGEAGAVDLYGQAMGLPKAISGHNSYFIWGPQGCNGKVIITVNYPLKDLSGSFESVQAAGQTSCTYCMPFENDAPIFIGRGLKVPIEDAWPSVKDYN